MAQDIGEPRRQGPPTIPAGGRRSAVDSTALVARPSTVLDASGREWMPPGNPPAPTGGQDERPRQFDYPIFWNVYRNPATAKSSDGGIDFTIMREFAKQTLVRAAIETIKDLDGQVEYTFTLRADANEKPGQTRKRAMNDRRVAQVSEFYESPDKIHDFVDWRRMAWEEILVCDNLSVYRWDYEFTSKGREPYAARILDGDTIEPIIDLQGYEPQGDDPAYDQWIKGVPRQQFNSRELLYTKFNPRAKYVFGHSPVEQVLWYINILIRRDLKKLAEYTDGNIPAALWSAPDGWTPTQIQDAQLWLDSYVAGDPQMRSKLIFVPGGPRPPVFPGERVQADPFDELLTRLIFFVFNVSVSSMVHQQNRATSDTNKEQAEEEGFAVRTRKMTRFINRVTRWAFGYSDVIAVPRQQYELDPVKQAETDFKNLQTGKAQVNELRERDGEEPIPQLVGVYGYFSAKGGFQTFDGAIASEAAQLQAIQSGQNATPAGQQDQPVVDDGDEQPTKVSKALKKKFSYASRR